MNTAPHSHPLCSLHKRVRNPHLRRAVPYKGNFAWEVQVGPFVFFWLHRDVERQSRGKRYFNEYLKAWLWEIRAGRFLVWNDPLWRV